VILDIYSDATKEKNTVTGTIEQFSSRFSWSDLAETERVFGAGGAGQIGMFWKVRGTYVWLWCERCA
jgi:hypothetical protein